MDFYQDCSNYGPRMNIAPALWVNLFYIDLYRKNHHLVNHKSLGLKSLTGHNKWLLLIIFVERFMPIIFLLFQMKMTCSNIVEGEWCASKFRKNVFIAIRRLSRSRTSDDVQLRVYLKDGK